MEEVKKQEKNKTGKIKKEKKEHQISISNIELYSVNGQKLSYDQSKEAPKLTRQNTLDLLEIQDKSFRIRVTEKLFFNAEGPFKLDLEVIGTYESDAKISESTVKKNLEKLARPLLSYSSLTIALLTERLDHIPIIVPPIKSDRDDNTSS
ncbi:MAG: hypothetical protein ACYC4E_01530 [Carboxydocellales bacterium]